MKRFLMVLTIGFFSFLVFSVIVELYQSKVVNNYSYKYWYMEEHPDEVKTLLLGSSMIENSINPHMVGDSTFNLAIRGRWIYYDYKLLEKYVTNMSNLKQVIFGMNYQNPFCQSYHFSESDNNDHEKYMYDKFMKISYDKGTSNWLGLYRNYIDKKTLCKNLSCDSLGYEGLTGCFYYECEEQDMDWEFIHEADAKEQIIEYTEYMAKMAELCSSNNVRFIVIMPPCHDNYMAIVSQEGLDVLHGIIEKVRSEYPVEYKNYLQDKEFRADSIYYNCVHMNSIGADMFALRVKKDFGL